MISIVVAVYGQPKMLARQLEEFATYQDDIRKHLELIIVDDHGDPAVTEQEGAAFGALLRTEVYRVLDDIPWNQMGARNLGMKMARHEWCLMIDPDMVIDAPTMLRMIAATNALKPGHLVKYGLKHVNEPKRDVDMSSPNTYLIRKSDFWQVGGYDEDFAGNKGWSDVQLLDVLKAHYKIHNRPDLHAHFYSTNQIDDAAVMTLDRSTKHNRAIRLRNAAKARKLGGWIRWTQRRADQTIRFKWDRIYPQT